MKIIQYKQSGGTISSEGVPTEEPMSQNGEMQQGEDPMMQIIQMMAEGLQNQDCQMLAEACAAFLQLVQQAQGGQPAPIGEAPQGQPVFKKGGKIVKRKCKK